VRPSPLERDASATQAGSGQSRPGNTLKPHYPKRYAATPFVGADHNFLGATPQKMGATVPFLGATAPKVGASDNFLGAPPPKEGAPRPFWGSARPKEGGCPPRKGRYAPRVEEFKEQHPESAFERARNRLKSGVYRLPARVADTQRSRRAVRCAA
jgi:hypothetical protein